MHTVHAYAPIYCRCLYFHWYQFSWIEHKSRIFGDSKFMVTVFSFIMHSITEIHYFVGTRIRGSDPPRKPRKLVPHEN